MCGLAAGFGPIENNVVETMLNRLAHRGPDDRKTLTLPQLDGVLGHCRLAIIDPTGGRQPFVDSDKGRAVIANGMIYNHRNLRSDLTQSQFQTGSDCEIILRGFSGSGADIAKNLDGMFAFVMADGARFVAARDPLGIKPLYISSNDHATLFASELKAFDGISSEAKEFPPGYVYDSEDGFRKYYDLPAPSSFLIDVDQVCSRLRHALNTAVVKRLQSDVPLGVFLSGGLDSSIIAALAVKQLGNLHTFAVGIDGSSDLEAARHVAEHLGTVHHEYVITIEDVLRDLARILFALESYDVDLVRSAIPCWFVSRLASEHVKVVLTGEGADELFAGYRYYEEFKEPKSLHNELRQSLMSLHNLNLQRVDRMTMAHGLEARVPFLDLEVIDLALRTHPALKHYRANGQRVVEKWILRHAFEDFLPPDVLWRDKEQFDEGSGILNIIRTALGDLLISWKQTARMDEEMWYRKVLQEQFNDPHLAISQTASWRGRIRHRRAER